MAMPTRTQGAVDGARSQQPPPPSSGLERTVLSLIKGIDTFSYYTGFVFATLTIFLMGSIVYNVIARYVFAAPTFWAYDVSYMLYGSAFMLGTAFALMRGAHVRTDFLYNRWSERTQGIVDSTLYIVLFFPAMWLFFEAGYNYAERSWGMEERSFLSPWQPIIYPFKTVIPVAIVLIMIQGISELLKSLYAATKGHWPSGKPTDPLKRGAG